MNIARLIDHTLLKPDATAADIEQLCAEARQYGFWSVCVNPCWVTAAARWLEGSAVKTCSVVGFPLGANCAAIKAAETRQAIADGATEIDTVLNIGALKGGDLDTARADLVAVAENCRAGSALSKVILETHLLTDDEKHRACELAVASGMDFVKTSTGFGGSGATVADVALLSRLVKPHGLGVKASGGIRSRAVLQQMVEAGATRIGTSRGVQILQEPNG